MVSHLDALAERLKRAGHHVMVAGAPHPHRKSLYYHDPEGFEFELVKYLSDEPRERNEYGGELGPVQRF